MNPAHLRRYTDLPAVLRMLSAQEITLLSPSTWDDQNDKNLLLAYRRCKGLRSLLALCFAQAPETYHHWKVFAPGSAGMCVIFEKERLLDELRGTGILHSSVSYLTIADLRGGDPPLDQIPFSKRAAYGDEQEFRLIYCDSDAQLSSKTFPMPIAAVDRVLINPWLAPQLAETVRQLIQGLPGCDRLPILQSTVIDGPAWKKLADRVQDRPIGA
jgi:hypothetical protein